MNKESLVEIESQDSRQNLLSKVKRPWADVTKKITQPDQLFKLYLDTGILGFLLNLLSCLFEMVMPFCVGYYVKLVRQNEDDFDTKERNLVLITGGTLLVSSFFESFKICYYRSKSFKLSGQLRYDL